MTTLPVCSMRTPVSSPPPLVVAPESNGPNEAVPVRIDGNSDLSYRSPFTDLPFGDDPRLPRRVDLRSTTSSFNRKWEFTLLDGALYLRHRGVKEPWRALSLPEGFTGTLVGISVDAQRLIGVDADGWLYTMKYALDGPEDFAWIRAWGGPGRIFDGFQIATVKPGQWCLSVITNNVDDSYTDSDGRVHPISFAGCSQVLFLDQSGQHIISCDPWLPRDYSYEVGGPVSNRFQAVSMSASASTIFMVNAYGDLYTRLHDYDFAGGDPTQFRYSWISHPNRPVGTSWREHRFNIRTAPIKIPPPPWKQHTKIPGDITDLISIHSTDSGSDNREMRVEGRRDGETGFWHKMLLDDEWSFTATGEPLQGTLLDNCPEDRTADTLGEPSPYSYEGVLRSWPNILVRVPHFSYPSSSNQVELLVFASAAEAATALRCQDFRGGDSHFLTMHTAYGRLATLFSQRFFSTRAFGLQKKPRYYAAALMIPPEVLAAKGENSEWDRFLTTMVSDDAYIPLYLKVTDKKLTIITPRLRFAAVDFPHRVTRLSRVQ